MSFKREGDDRGLLHNLRRRRINELLAEEIPEDEAKLLCNGRFACLVCGHNPIFDTVNMLMVHRHGKKHAASEVEFVRKKKELHALILKRKHEQYMKDGTTNIRQSASTVSGGIILMQPYDPRVKKQKLKPYDRKLRLDLLHSDPTSASKSQDASASSSTSSPALLEEIPTKHSHQLKNIFRPAQRLQFPVQPYLRQHRTDTSGGSTSLTPSASQFQTSVSSSEHRSHIAFYSMGPIQSNPASSAIVPSSVLSKKSSFTESVSLVSKQLNYSSSSYSRVASLDKERVPSESGVSVSCVTGMQQNSSLGCGAGSHLSSLNCDRLNDSAVVGWSGGDSVQCSVSHADSVVRTQGKSSAPSTAANDTPKKKLSQQYHLLQGSGWKKDWDGKWIRDEEAEFDSDEEAPDLP